MANYRRAHALDDDAVLSGVEELLDARTEGEMLESMEGILNRIRQNSAARRRQRRTRRSVKRTNRQRTRQRKKTRRLENREERKSYKQTQRLSRKDQRRDRRQDHRDERYDQRQARKDASRQSALEEELQALQPLTDPEELPIDFYEDDGFFDDAEFFDDYEDFSGFGYEPSQRGLNRRGGAQRGGPGARGGMNARGGMRRGSGGQRDGQGGMGPRGARGGSQGGLDRRGLGAPRGGRNARGGQHGTRGGQGGSDGSFNPAAWLDRDVKIRARRGYRVVTVPSGEGTWLVAKISEREYQRRRQQASVSGIGFAPLLATAVLRAATRVRQGVQNVQAHAQQGRSGSGLVPSVPGAGRAGQTPGYGPPQARLAPAPISPAPAAPQLPVVYQPVASQPAVQRPSWPPARQVRHPVYGTTLSGDIAGGCGCGACPGCQG